MGFTYLKTQTWRQVTREERFFCSHLYHSLIGKENEFLGWLNKKLDLNLPAQIEWEVSYEVCFYRDYYKTILNQTAPEEIRKRTFDLCLFSESLILIIEAKVQQDFEKDQIEFLKEDVERIENLLDNKVKVIPILLGTQKHIDNLKILKKFTEISDLKIITWLDLFEEFRLDVFIEAEKSITNKI